MSELFKTVLSLSLFGFVITAVLLCLKPFTAKRFPASWQYCVWIAVLVSMITPAYKLIDAKNAQKIAHTPKNTLVQTEHTETPLVSEGMSENQSKTDLPIEYWEIHITPKHHVSLMNLSAYIWFGGMCIYLIIVLLSYTTYITKRRRNAVAITDYALLDDIKRELNIKRNIKIKMAEEVQSPLLVGVIFPVIYIPCREIPPENMRMVFLHELMHYKRKDLVVKWFSILVNAIHWFNPLVYLLSANLSQACEISCDMKVTENMNLNDRKLYMKTILDLVE